MAGAFFLAGSMFMTFAPFVTGDLLSPFSSGDFVSFLCSLPSRCFLWPLLRFSPMNLFASAFPPRILFPLLSRVCRLYRTPFIFLVVTALFNRILPEKFHKPLFLCLHKQLQNIKLLRHYYTSSPYNYIICYNLWNSSDFAMDKHPVLKK